MTTYTHIPIVDDWFCQIELSPYLRQGFSGRQINQVFIELIYSIIAKQLQDPNHRVYPQWEHLWAYNETEELNVADELFNFPPINPADLVLENLWHKTYVDTSEDTERFYAISRFGTSGGEQREIADNALFYDWCCDKFSVDSVSDICSFRKEPMHSHFITNNLLTEFKSAWTNSGISIKQKLIDNAASSKPSEKYVGVLLTTGMLLDFIAYLTDTDRSSASTTILNSYVTALKTNINDISTVYISSDDATVLSQFIALCKEDDTLKDLNFINKSDILRRIPDYIDKVYDSNHTIDYYEKYIEDALILGQCEKLIVGYSSNNILVSTLSNLSSSDIIILDEINHKFSDEWMQEIVSVKASELGKTIMGFTYGSKQPYGS